MTDKDTLLVVIDMDDAGVAIERAAHMASRSKVRIELFSCLYDAVIANERAFESGDLFAAKKRRLEARREELDALAAPLREQGLDVSVEVAWDKPVYEGIVRHALKLRPRMILTGT